MFQGKFAIITPALIAGAFAERVRFRGYCIFIALWSLLVYSPLCHWVWASDGFLFQHGGASTSPAARWSTSRRASAPWSRPCTSAPAAAIRAPPCTPTTWSW